MGALVSVRARERVRVCACMLHVLLVRAVSSLLSMPYLCCCLFSFLPSHSLATRALKRNLKAKKQMFETNSGMDWAVGEALAFGTLLLEGNHGT
jgi:hypothetical protein